MSSKKPRESKEAWRVRAARHRQRLQEQGWKRITIAVPEKWLTVIAERGHHYEAEIIAALARRLRLPIPARVEEVAPEATSRPIKE